MCTVKIGAFAAGANMAVIPLEGVNCSAETALKATSILRGLVAGEKIFTVENEKKTTMAFKLVSEKDKCLDERSAEKIGDYLGVHRVLYPVQ